MVETIEDLYSYEKITRISSTAFVLSEAGLYPMFETRLLTPLLRWLLHPYASPYVVQAAVIHDN